MSESSVVNKSTTPRRWAAVSFEVTLALISWTHLSMYYDMCVPKSHMLNLVVFAFSGLHGIMVIMWVPTPTYRRKQLSVHGRRKCSTSPSN